MLVGRTSSFSFRRPVSQASYPGLKQFSNFTLGSQCWSCISHKRRNVTKCFIRSIHNQPLRILFCGADELSITSLEALHKELLESPSNVASIDVVCRPGKPSGRGLKQIRHPPIKDAAERLGLPVHQINTFTGWKLPNYNLDLLPRIDLVVAVSFGLLVPPRILKATTYGGINVHPSLLPSFRGPAPLHWIILRGETNTGVTLQTLHPTEFDAGVVLDQTPEPGVPIPNPASYTYADLRRMSSVMSAEMLIKSIRERTFVPPYNDVRKGSTQAPTRPASFAPKIEPKTRCLDFQSMSSSHILRMNRAIAPLWAEARLASENSTTSVIFGPNMYLSEVPNAKKISTIEPGLPYLSFDENDQFKTISAPLMINTVDGQTLVVPTLKLPGTTYRPAAALAQSANLLLDSSKQQAERVLTFHEPLKVPQDIRGYVKSVWQPA